MPVGSAKSLIDEVYEANAEDRALIRAELKGLATPLSTEQNELAWRAELIRRVQSLNDGSAELHDWEDVKHELEEIVEG